jgi:hypothetical protein
MGKHTPGKWKAVYEIDVANEGWIVKSDARPYVASVLWGAIASETEANARLIAAAPDLLAAISEIIEYAEQYLDLCDGDHPACEASIEMARNAIRKATGEAE